MRWPLLLVCLTLVTACGAEEQSDAGSTSASSTSPMDDMTASAPSTETSTRRTPTGQASTTSTDPVTTIATTTTTSVESLVELRADGLGDLDFGEPTDAVMEALVDLFGPPDPGEEYPYGGHPLRFVYWDNQGLAVVFSDYEFYRDDGVEHLAGWTHSRYIGHRVAWDGGATSLTLEAADEIGIGSTLADLQSVYGDQVVLEAECDPGGPPTAAYVQFAGPNDGPISTIRFGFEDLPLNPTSRIAGLTAGAGPGC